MFEFFIRLPIPLSGASFKFFQSIDGNIYVSYHLEIEHSCDDEIRPVGLGDERVAVERFDDAAAKIRTMYRGVLAISWRRLSFRLSFADVG